MPHLRKLRAEEAHAVDDGDNGRLRAINDVLTAISRALLQRKMIMMIDE